VGTLRELLEDVEELLAKLSEDVDRGIPVVVEGRSDVEALRSLGIRARFLVAKSCRRTVADMALELASGSSAGEVIILTDFDAAGVEQARRWAEELESLGLKANLTYWRALRALVGSFTKDVEGLPGLVDTLRRRLGRAGLAGWAVPR